MEGPVLSTHAAVVSADAAGHPPPAANLHTTPRPVQRPVLATHAPEVGAEKAGHLPAVANVSTTLTLSVCWSPVQEPAQRSMPCTPSTSWGSPHGGGLLLTPIGGPGSGSGPRRVIGSPATPLERVQGSHGSKERTTPNTRPIPAHSFYGKGTKVMLTARHLAAPLGVDRLHSGAPVGLFNSQNWCYMISVIQALHALPVMVAALRARQQDGWSDSARALAALTDQMTQSQGGSVDPDLFFRQFQWLSPDFVSGRQCDALVRVKLKGND